MIVKQNIQTLDVIERHWVGPKGLKVAVCIATAFDGHIILTINSSLLISQ